VALARVLRRPFSVLAGVSVALLAITGLYALGAQVASVDALLTTFYGETLLAKVGLVMVAGLLGLVNGSLLRRLVSGRRPVAISRVRRLILLELVTGLEVVAAAGVLASSSPPPGSEFVPSRPAPVPTLVRQQGDLLVSASLRPNRPGTNAVTVVAASSLRPPPAPIEGVGVLLSAPGEAAQRVRLAGLAPGRFTGTASLPQDGRWSMIVAVRRAGQRFSPRFAWTVAPSDRSRPVQVSAHPLAPIVDRIALIGLLVLTLLGAWLAAAGWRRAGRAFTAGAMRA
jgi:copper transport protein